MAEVTLHVIHETDLAVATKLDPNDEFEQVTWIPKSVIDNLDQLVPFKFDDVYDLDIQEWWAMENALI